MGGLTLVQIDWTEVSRYSIGQSLSQQDNSSAVDIDTRPSARSQVRHRRVVFFVEQQWFCIKIQRFANLSHCWWCLCHCLENSLSTSRRDTGYGLIIIMRQNCSCLRWNLPCHSKSRFVSLLSRLKATYAQEVLLKLQAETQKLCGAVWSLWLLGWIHKMTF